MALILNFETSTKVCSVSLGKDDDILAHKEIEESNYSHSENLTLFIEAVLIEAKKDISEIDAIAISEGPGSYTGLRIGTSTAKGLCFALGVPLIVIPTLEILAYQFRDGIKEYIVPCLDARRMEVFYALYSVELELMKETNAGIIDEEFLDNYKSNSILFVGDGAYKMKDFLSGNWKIQKNSNISSKGMVSLAFKKFIKEDFADTAYFEPFYLKDFVAGTPKKWFS